LEVSCAELAKDGKASIDAAPFTGDEARNVLIGVHIGRIASALEKREAFIAIEEQFRNAQPSV
jgi:hypothetical protein